MTNSIKNHQKLAAYCLAASLLVTLAIARGADSPLSAGPAASQQPPVIPTGLDSYLMWETVQGKEIYPAHTDRGRYTKGSSEFTVKVDPNNLGVLLRRKLDYAFPNQRAEVYVADVKEREDGAKESGLKQAGVWYLAGSNTCVYSNPKEELGATVHIVQTSNRRFREDEFLIPRELTEGRKKIRVRVKFTPVPTPLFPGQPAPELAWSEINYSAYSFIMPRAWIKGRY